MKGENIKSSRDIIKILTKDGWYLKRVVGSHHHFNIQPNRAR
ncbi:type II toxin-antitoxin system HicA family toxin [Bacillus amyloliquefaciens]